MVLTTLKKYTRVIYTVGPDSHVYKRRATVVLARCGKMAPVNFYVQKCSGDWLEGKGMKEVEENVRLSVMYGSRKGRPSSHPRVKFVRASKNSGSVRRRNTA